MTVCTESDISMPRTNAVLNNIRSKDLTATRKRSLRYPARTTVKHEEMSNSATSQVPNKAKSSVAEGTMHANVSCDAKNTKKPLKERAKNGTDKIVAAAKSANGKKVKKNSSFEKEDIAASTPVHTEDVGKEEEADTLVEQDTSDSESEPAFERREMPLRYTRGTRYFSLLDIVKAGGHFYASAADSLFYGNKMWEESESDHDWDPKAIYGANANKLLKCKESEPESDSEEEEDSDESCDHSDVSSESDEN